jgi:hypothetical protein
MWERRDGREQVRSDRLACDEQIDRLQPRGEGRIDEVFAFAREQARPRALGAALQPADELEPRVRR